MFRILARVLVKVAVSATCVFLCLTSVPVFGDEAPSGAGAPSFEPLRLIDDGDDSRLNPQPPFSLAIQDPAAGMNFDLGGSETRKLQLQLDHPLTISLGSQAQALGNGGSLLGLDATLSLPLTGGLSLAGGVSQEMGTMRFQQVGSIHCMNGVLRPDSYTASGCRFVNEPYSALERQRIRLGALLEGELFDAASASASISWFTQDAALDYPGARRLNRPSGGASLTPSLLAPVQASPLLPPTTYGQPLQYFDSGTSGVDLNFRLGIATDSSGDLRFGLALTRVLDASYQGLYDGGSDLLGWSIAEPFDTARLNVEWSRGAFSSGIQGFYREPVNFLNRNSLESMTTFDVHFTWRTPWNANLSVGASNVLSGGAEEPGISDNQPADPFESVYGRIPYVRYQQDL